MRATKRLAESHIRGEAMLSYAGIGEFTAGTAVLSNYMFDLIASWGSEFGLQVEQLLAAGFGTLSVGVAAALYCLFDLLFVRQFGREYAFYRYAFNKMVPQFVLVREKVAKHKFITHKIIANS